MGGAPAEPKTPKAGSREPSFNAEVEQEPIHSFSLKNIIWDTTLTFPGIQKFLEVGSQPGSKRRLMRHEKCKQAQIGKTRVIAIELIIHGISKRFFDKKMVPYHKSYELITQDLPLHLLVICIIQSVVKLAPVRGTDASILSWAGACVGVRISDIVEARVTTYSRASCWDFKRFLPSFMIRTIAIQKLLYAISSKKLHECFSRSNHSEAIFAKRRLDKNQFEGDFWKIFPKLKGLNDPWVFFYRRTSRFLVLDSDFWYTRVVLWEPWSGEWGGCGWSCTQCFQPQGPTAKIFKLLKPLGQNWSEFRRVDNVSNIISRWIWSYCSICT